MKTSWAQAVVFLTLGVLLGAVGLGFIRGSGPDIHAAAAGGVLASVEGREITEDEVEKLRPTEFLNLYRQLHDLRTRTLETIISEELIKLEADARGMEPTDLLQTEVDETVGNPTEEQVEAFFQERNLQGSIEDLAPQIRSYLRDQERSSRFASFLADLEVRYRVARNLEPWRVEVESEGSPSKGPRNAPVTLVAFSDFQCPYCRAIIPTLEQIEETYGNQVRFVFRQFPLTQIHPQAVDAAQASLCADEQDRFWEMHDAMFENQRALEVEQLKSTARSVGLDGPEFDACLDSDRYASQVTDDLEAGRALGITGTPVAFINGRAVSGAKPYEEFAEIIEDELRRLRK